MRIYGSIKRKKKKKEKKGKRGITEKRKEDGKKNNSL